MLFSIGCFLLIVGFIVIVSRMLKDIHTGESTLHSDKIAIVGFVMHASGAGLIVVSLCIEIIKHLL
jgi:hypothetical protein